MTRLLYSGHEKPAPDGAVLPINRPAVRRQHSLAASHYPFTLSRLPTCWPDGGRSRISASSPLLLRTPERGRLNQGTRAPGLGY